MTVIMGINLSDRICLVADSRVSELDPVTREFKTKHDDMMKIENLKEVRGAMIACAGNAELAKRALKAIERGYKGKSIAELRVGIEESLRKVGEDYGTINNRAHANFLIAGVDETSKKTINKARFNTIAMGEYAPKNQNGSMGAHIHEALKATKEGDEFLTLPVANTVLFSATLDLVTGTAVHDSEWGDVLVSGPTETTSEDVGNDEIAKLEFEHPGSTEPYAQIDKDSMLSVAIASTMARKHDWLTVGGTYIPIQLYETNQAVFLPRQIASFDPVTMQTETKSAYAMENGKFYRVMPDGSMRRLSLVSEIGDTKAKRKEQKGELQI